MSKNAARPLTSGGRTLAIEKKNGTIKKKSKRGARSENGGKTYPVEDAAIRVRSKLQDDEATLRAKLLEKDAEAARLIGEKNALLATEPPTPVPASLQSSINVAMAELAELDKRIVPFDQWNGKHNADTTIESVLCAPPGALADCGAPHCSASTGECC
jgi:hypothetical protein